MSTFSFFFLHKFSYIACDITSNVCKQYYLISKTILIIVKKSQNYTHFNLHSLLRGFMRAHKSNDRSSMIEAIRDQSLISDSPKNFPYARLNEQT